MTLEDIAYTINNEDYGVKTVNDHIVTLGRVELEALSLQMALSLADMDKHLDKNEVCKIKSKIQKKPLPDLEVGTAVLVWEDDDSPKRRRRFKKFTKKGKIVCFKGGYAGLHNRVSKWKHWELAE